MYHFLSIYPLSNPENLNFEKNEKKYARRYHHFTHLYLKWKSYDVWFLRYWVRQAEFFVIVGHFLSFYPPNNLKNLNFEKMKKIPGDIIILYVQQMMVICYVSWNMDSNSQIFCHYGSSFTQKIKILEKWKKHLEISKVIIMLYCSWDLARDM